MFEPPGEQRFEALPLHRALAAGVRELRAASAAIRVAACATPPSSDRRIICAAVSLRP